MSAHTNQLPTDGNALDEKTLDGKTRRGTRALLAAERDTALRARDTIQAQHDAVRAERDAVRAERDTVKAELDAAFKLRDTIQSERDTMKSALDAVKAQLDKLAAEHERVKQELRMRMRMLFGRRSERMSDDELVLFADFIEAEKDRCAKQQGGEQAAEEGSCDVRHVAAHTRKIKNGRAAIPAHLPREDCVHDIPEAQKKCPCCGAPRVCIGEEVFEQYECEPAKVKVIRHVTKKYACPDCRAGVELALRPRQAIAKCKAAPGMLATVAVSKFADHAPLYRQEGILLRSGAMIPRSTMCDWMRQVAVALAPLVAMMKERVLAWAVIGTDDTPVKMLEPGRGSAKETRIWVYANGATSSAPGYAVFDFSISREGKWPRKWLDGWVKEGEVKHLQADAFSGYDALYLDPPAIAMGGSGGSGGMKGRIIEVGCWAHPRRKFYDTRKIDHKLCLPVLMLIKKLYAVEAVSGELKEDADARAARRKEHAAPVLAQIKALLDAGLPRALPKSGVGEAISYALNQWAALTRYIENGLLPIDNNACERAIRAVALGRKNWLFFGSEEGGHTAAAMFTIIGSARLHQIEPWAYVKDVLERIPDATSAQLRELLPDVWIKAHPQHFLPSAR